MSKKGGHIATNSITELQQAVEALSENQNTAKKKENLAYISELFFKETAKLEEQCKAANSLLEENQKLKSEIKALNLTSIHLSSIINNITQGVLFIDFNGIITTYNHSSERILRKSSKQTLLQLFWDVFEDRCFGFSMREVLDTKQIFKAFRTLLHGHSAKQTNIEIDTTYTQEGMILLIRDMSDIVRLKAIAAHNDRMKELGEMAAMVAHEIRNPLGGIKGFASLLQRDLAEQPHLNLLATYIVEGTDSLDRLVNNVLNYSRPLSLMLEDTDITKLLEELILHLNADESIDPRIELHTKSSLENIIANVDSQALKSAILNLCSNAIKAMPKGGELYLLAEDNACETVIKIVDTGEGIPPENLHKIFVPFFTTRSQGHGFGLSEVHKIVEAHGGQITVSSVLKQGTTFTIRIPHNSKG